MLELRDFRLYSGDATLLRAEHHVVPVGSKQLIVGANGCGKTLLAHAIGNEYRAWDGDITLRNEPVSDRKTILIDKDLHLLLDETLWRNLIIPMPRMTERLKGRIVELAAVAELADKLKRKVEYLSYSGAKFVELIRAVAQLPFLIVIDDIDHAFDEANLQKALQICTQASNSGAIILATASRPLPGFDSIYHFEDEKLEVANA